MNEEKIERKSPIQKVAKIILPEEQAKIEWKKYVELLKTRKDKHLKIMKEAMFFAKQGKPLLDVFEAIKKAGLNVKNEPRFAIVRADMHSVYFEKQDEGSGTYGWQTQWQNSLKWDRTNVSLPGRTFPIHWERILRPDGTVSWEIKNKLIISKVPIIPADLIPDGDLSNYYILWEVKQWEKLPEPKDPYLLKRISENLFVILGAWEITELERAVISGLK